MVSASKANATDYRKRAVQKGKKFRNMGVKQHF